jgi:hypothetical protein
MASNCVARLNKVLNTVNDQKITDVAYKAFVKNTPVRSGNARRNTRKSGNAIDANYAYAQRLEEGWSKQAPKGMTEPTIEEVRDYVYRTLGIRI